MNQQRANQISRYVIYTTMIAKIALGILMRIVDYWKHNAIIGVPECLCMYGTRWVDLHPSKGKLQNTHCIIGNRFPHPIGRGGVIVADKNILLI